MPCPLVDVSQHHTLELVQSCLDLDALGRTKVVDPCSPAGEVLANPGIGNGRREPLRKAVDAGNVQPRRIAQRRGFHVLGDNR